jgi:hypothetical protein
MSFLNRKKNVNKDSLTAQEIEIAESLIESMTCLVAEAYGVISVIRMGEKLDSLYIHEVKHLLILNKDDTLFIVNVQEPGYLSYDEFSKYFAKQMKSEEKGYDTIVTFKIFDADPTSPSMEDSPIQAYHWTMQELTNSASAGIESIPNFPPGISIVDGEIVDDLNRWQDMVFKNSFVSFYQEEDDTAINSNDFLASLLSNAYYGLHVFSCFWKHDDIYFHKASVFNKKQGSLRLIKEDNVMGLLNHNLMMVNLQARINSGKTLYITFQSFPGDEQGNSEMRSWEIRGELLLGLTAEKCKELLETNSAPTNNQGITYVDA